jgi:hypothetical protein
MEPTSSSPAHHGNNNGNVNMAASPPANARHFRVPSNARFNGVSPTTNAPPNTTLHVTSVSMDATVSSNPLIGSAAAMPSATITSPGGGPKRSLLSFTFNGAHSSSRPTHAQNYSITFLSSLLREANQIMMLYLMPGSPFEINVSAETRRRTNRLYQDLSARLDILINNNLNQPITIATVNNTHGGSTASLHSHRSPLIVPMPSPGETHISMIQPHPLVTVPNTPTPGGYGNPSGIGTPPHIHHPSSLAVPLAITSSPLILGRALSNGPTLTASASSASSPSHATSSRVPPPPVSPILPLPASASAAAVTTPSLPSANTIGRELASDIAALFDEAHIVVTNLMQMVLYFIIILTIVILISYDFYCVSIS